MPRKSPSPSQEPQAVVAETVKETDQIDAIAPNPTTPEAPAAIEVVEINGASFGLIRN
jgi:hypothetical protein